MGKGFVKDSKMLKGLLVALPLLSVGSEDAEAAVKTPQGKQQQGNPPAKQTTPLKPAIITPAKSPAPTPAKAPTPAQTPAKVPAATPAKTPPAPVQKTTPVQTPVKSPAPTPVKSPAPTSGKAPTPVQTPGKPAVTTPVKAPAPTPVKLPAPTPGKASTPVQTPGKSPAPTPGKPAVTTPVKVPAPTPVKVPAPTPGKSVAVTNQVASKPAAQKPAIQVATSKLVVLETPAPKPAAQKPAIQAATSKLVVLETPAPKPAVQKPAIQAATSKLVVLETPAPKPAVQKPAATPAVLETPAPQPQPQNNPQGMKKGNPPPPPPPLKNPKKLGKHPAGNPAPKPAGKANNDINEQIKAGDFKLKPVEAKQEAPVQEPTPVQQTAENLKPVPTAPVQKQAKSTGLVGIFDSALQSRQESKNPFANQQPAPPAVLANQQQVPQQAPADVNGGHGNIPGQIPFIYTPDPVFLQGKQLMVDPAENVYRAMLSNPAHTNADVKVAAVKLMTAFKDLRQIAENRLNDINKTLNEIKNLDTQINNSIHWESIAFDNGDDSDDPDVIEALIKPVKDARDALMNQNPENARKALIMDIRSVNDQMANIGVEVCTKLMGTPEDATEIRQYAIEALKNLKVDVSKEERDKIDQEIDGLQQSAQPGSAFGKPTGAKTDDLLIQDFRSAYQAKDKAAIMQLVETPALLNAFITLEKRKDMELEKQRAAFNRTQSPVLETNIETLFKEHYDLSKDIKRVGFKRLEVLIARKNTIPPDRHKALQFEIREVGEVTLKALSVIETALSNDLHPPAGKLGKLRTKKMNHEENKDVFPKGTKEKQESKMASSLVSVISKRGLGVAHGKKGKDLEDPTIP